MSSIEEQRKNIQRTKELEETMVKFGAMAIKTDLYLNRYYLWLLHHAQFFNFDLEPFFKTGSLSIKME